MKKFLKGFVISCFTIGGSKKKLSKKAAFETGTGKGNSNEVDFEWIPKSSLLSTPGGKEIILEYVPALCRITIGS